MFLWHTIEGEVLSSEEMETSHLFYSLRMIFNHVCDPNDKIKGCKEYDFRHFQEQGATKLKRSVQALTTELATRKDISVWMLGQLQYMNSIVNGGKFLDEPNKKKILV